MLPASSVATASGLANPLSSPVIAGTSITTSALGAHTLEFWSVDVAGNIETHKAVNFTVTAPVPPTTGVTQSIVTIKTEDNARLRRGVGLEGELTPASGGEVVSIYVMVPGSTTWTLLSTSAVVVEEHNDEADDDAYEADDDAYEADTDASTTAKWAYRYSPVARGTYRFQARFAGDADSTASVTRIVRVNVR